MEHISDLNFSIIGVAKSGTTSLAKWLNMHPQICISNPKETNYFVRKSINSISDSDPLKEHIMNMSRLNTKDFLDSFDKGGHKVFGEASVHNFMYLDEFISEAPRNLKIILILRDPIQRALSNFNYLSHLIDGDFNQHIQRYNFSKMNDEWGEFWNFFEQGKTSDKIKILENRFEHTLFLQYEDLKKDPLYVLKTCEDFLNVTPFEGYRTDRNNVTRIPNKIHSLTKFFPFRKYLVTLDFPLKKWLINKLLRKRPSTFITPENMDKLRSYYREDG